MLGTPVYKLRDEMPYDEYAQWMTFFEKRPVGWREDQRTSFILNALGVKQKGTEIFSSLKTMHANSAEPDIAQSLKKSSFFQKMLGAVGGDRLDFLYASKDEG